jgi:uncharacterized protein (DUF2336 family)
MVRTKDVVLMATVSSYESMTHPGRHELKQFAELFEPVFKASSVEARRNAVAALSRCETLPQAVALFLANQPIEIAALFLTRSKAIDDNTLIAVARTQGPAHAKAIAARENLSVKVVDALVALHQGHDFGRPITQETKLPELSSRSSEREEQVRLQLKSLVYRDTLERTDSHEDDMAEMRDALLIRFARLREARDFSATLANILSSSLWLTNRIMLDVSGVQLATALIAIDTQKQDGIFILKQFYPHLNAMNGETGRAEMLWHGLNVDDCRERLRVWIRADDITRGKQASDDVANANEAIQPLTVPRPAFGHARGTSRR